MTSPTWGDSATGGGPSGYGGQTPAPLNRPPTAPLGYGVQPGSQQFFTRLIVAGPVGSGVFVYNGAAAAGNLIASLAGPQTTTDPFGNPVLPELAIYGPGGQAIQLVDTGGILLENFLTGNAGESSPAQLKAGVASGVLQFITGGAIAVGSTDGVFMNLTSQISTANFAKGFLSYQLSTGGDVNLFSWGADGVFRGTLAGNTGSVGLNSTDGFSRTVTQAVLTQLTFNYPVNANDPIVTAGHQNTTYGIRCGGSGTQGSTAEALTFALVGFGTTLGSFQFLAPSLPANHGFTWYLDGAVEILTTGATGTGEVVGLISIFDTTALLAVGTVPLVASVGSLNTTANTSLSVQASWASAAFGCTITCPASRFSRWGP